MYMCSLMAVKSIYVGLQSVMWQSVPNPDDVTSQRAMVQTKMPKRNDATHQSEMIHINMDECDDMQAFSTCKFFSISVMTE
jgi:hypothetical protein